MILASQKRGLLVMRLSASVERLVRTALTMTLSEYRPYGFASLDR